MPSIKTVPDGGTIDVKFFNSGVINANGFFMRFSDTVVDQAGIIALNDGDMTFDNALNLYSGGSIFMGLGGDGDLVVPNGLYIGENSVVTGIGQIA
jgi:hypothetical protein